MFDRDNVEPYPQAGELMYDPSRHTPRCAHPRCRATASSGKPYCFAHLTDYDGKSLDDTSCGYL